MHRISDLRGLPGAFPLLPKKDGIDRNGFQRLVDFVNNKIACYQIPLIKPGAQAGVIVQVMGDVLDRRAVLAVKTEKHIIGFLAFRHNILSFLSMARDKKFRGLCRT
ncbi:hypothetical protein U27_04036 [Candidatus Vecturithrix granuli]|uniref:Uncharacterized protein n=1 Tax=Vecturithrix granuli TaxID=1499967 RepID=A0A081BXL7_VECG1|nr:hypothetical protein U27_04036 [Candidatus Vecturithrix granuli]